jgi:hypothetical protein
MIDPPNPLFKGGIKQDNYSPLEKEAGDWIKMTKSYYNKKQSLCPRSPQAWYAR